MTAVVMPHSGRIRAGCARPWPARSTGRAAGRWEGDVRRDTAGGDGDGDGVGDGPDGRGGHRPGGRATVNKAIRRVGRTGTGPEDGP